jgi:large subunit ribosomal protein L15
MLTKSIHRNPGATPKRKRVGRGPGSGVGKTCGRGHKGQKARSGGNVRLGFEGGQMPIQRRLPKSGFTSQKSLFRDEVRLAELAKVEGSEVTLSTLKQAGVVGRTTLDVKIILKGDVTTAYQVTGVRVSKGARLAIEKAGGKVND